MRPSSVNIRDHNKTTGLILSVLCTFALSGNLGVAQTAPRPVHGLTLSRTAETVANLAVAGVHVLLPVWGGKEILCVDLNDTAAPIILGVDRTGATEQLQFSIPGAAEIFVWSVNGAADGSIILGGTAVDNDSQGTGFLAVIPADRSKKILIRTAPFIPRAVALAPDSALWAVGWDMDAGRRVYNVLKRFDRSGRLLSSSNVDLPGENGFDATYGSKLVAIKDRVGWLTGGPRSNPKDRHYGRYEYREFSLDGRQLDQFACPPWHPAGELWISLGLSNDGQVALASRGNDQSIWLLNRKERSWDEVQPRAGKLDKFAMLFGFDGDELVIASRIVGGSHRITRYRVAQGDSPTN